MNECFVVSTGAILPGEAVPSDQIQDYLGVLDGETEVMSRVLRMNGIRQRYYAQDKQQRATESVYSMAAKAVRCCLANRHQDAEHPFSFLAAGSTHAPLSGPGLATITHDRLRNDVSDRPIEISSHSGICTSGAAAFVGAFRAIRCGDHDCAIAVGAEHASEVLKTSALDLIDDRDQHPEDIRRSRWFMSVFLRFMLSDGAGAVMMQNQPGSQTGTSDTRQARPSLRVDWVHSRSFAHQTELCMKLENHSRLLSQDVSVLSRYLIPSTESFLRDALASRGERLDDYHIVLPHLSSFFFRRRMERLMRSLAEDDSKAIPYWTNLATAGNTGAASIFVMLDEYLRTNRFRDGERMLLFVPESGQFNFVLISLTAVAA